MNYDILHFFSQHITTIAITVITFMFFGKMYHAKYGNQTVYVAVFAVWTVLMLWINSYKLGLLNVSFFIISAEIICLFLFDTSFYKSILYNVMMFMLLFFNDVITYILWTVLLQVSFDSISDNPQLMLISNILNIVISFIEYRMLTLIFGKDELKVIKLQETVFLFFMTIIECYIIYSMSVQIRGNEGGVLTFIVLITFFIFDVYLMYIIRKVADLYKYKYDTELITIQSNIQLEHYMEMEHTYQEARHIIHDMKQHLTVMEDLNNSESSEYGSTLEIRLESLFGGFQCSNQIL